MRYIFYFFGKSCYYVYIINFNIHRQYLKNLSLFILSLFFYQSSPISLPTTFLKKHMLYLKIIFRDLTFYTRFTLYFRLILLPIFIAFFTKTAIASSFIPTHEQIFAFDKSEYQIGQWSQDPNHLIFQQGDEQAKWNLWIPEQEGSFVNGTLRSVVALGSRPDFTLILRYQKHEEDIFSGYGFSLEKDKFCLYKWDYGRPKEITQSKIVSDLPQTLEIIYSVINHFIFITVNDAQTHQNIVTMYSTDTQFNKGQVAIRAYKLQDINTKFLHLGYSEVTSNLNVSKAIDMYRNSGVAIVSNIAPELLHEFEILEALDNNKYSILFLNRIDLNKITNKGGVIEKATSDVPFKFESQSYKRARQKLEINSYDPFTDVSYRDSDMIYDFLEKVHEKYPKITKLTSLGSTRMGKEIWALRITDNPNQDEDEPCIIINSAHHGSELLSMEFSLDVIKYLVFNSTQSEQKNIIDNFDVWVVPLVNPDGNYAFWNINQSVGRKNHWDENNNNILEFNEGVDLNRNYPFKWGALGEKGSSSHFNHYWYRGSTPASEPETQAMMKLANQYHPAIVFSYHTSGNMILSPYTIDDTPIPQPDVAWEFAEKLVYNLPNAPYKSRPMKVYRNMYSVDGTDQDWYFNTFGSLAYIIEGPFHNPQLNVRNLSIDYMKPLYTRMFELMLTGPRIYGNIQDKQGNPVKAVVQIEEYQTFFNEQWTSREIDGRFDRVLSRDGEYTVIVKNPKNQKVYTKRVTVKGPTEIDFRFD